MAGETRGEDRHRADYLLERGIWRATCRLCGWQIADPIRRQAASLFRFHIRDALDGSVLAGAASTGGQASTKVQPGAVPAALQPRI